MKHLWPFYFSSWHVCGILFEWRGKFVASVGDLSEGNLPSKKRRHEAERANQPVGESGRNRKGIFLRDLYIFLASMQNPSTWRNSTKTLEFSIKTRSWRCVFSPKIRKREVYFLSNCLAQIFVDNSRGGGGEKDKHEKNCGVGRFLSKEEKQGFQQWVPG